MKDECKKLFVLENSGYLGFFLVYQIHQGNPERSKISKHTEDDVLEMLFVSQCH